jgi:hypothetical protein
MGAWGPKPARRLTLAPYNKMELKSTKKLMGLKGPKGDGIGQKSLEEGAKGNLAWGGRFF